MARWGDGPRPGLRSAFASRLGSGRSRWKSAPGHLALVLLLLSSSSCLAFPFQPVIAQVLVNQYDARVVVYHAGTRCRLDVVTPTLVIQTAWTRCEWLVRP